jgi:hypothetical protein
MDTVMIFDDKAKMRLGLICFTPVLCFFICFVFYLILILPLTQGHHVPASDVGILSQNYDILFIMLAISAIITAPIFIYCLVILTRFKHLNAAVKLQWIIFLSVLAPIASAFFWMIHIKGLPKKVNVYPDIA